MITMTHSLLSSPQLCAGAIRAKNSMNILLQTIMDAAVSAIAFYLVGFGFAYGEGPNPNPFIGNALFALSRYESSFSGSSNVYAWSSSGASDNAADGRWTDFFYQWAFAATATTIPAGAVAERFNFNAYLGYTWFISLWVYPVVVHWAWSRQGWLTFNTPGPTGRTKFLFNCGFIDFAGSGVVHIVGGTCGLVGAILVGPRLGRFDASGRPVDMPGHSAVLVVLGTVILWFGW
jgi:ammonium transporter, Amt family